MKFRKKPVVIEAILYAGKGNMDPRGDVPDWLWEAFEKDVARSTNGGDPLLLSTLEGDLTVSPGDWIIQGVKGELYPCKPDIFAVLYDPEPAGALGAGEPPADLQPILAEMQAASDHIDATYGTSAYNVALVELALLARHCLRELAASRVPEKGPA